MYKKQKFSTVVDIVIDIKNEENLLSFVCFFFYKKRRGTSKF